MEIRLAIIQDMLPPENSGRKQLYYQSIFVLICPTDPNFQPRPHPLLHALSAPPTNPLDPADVTSTHIAALMFSHLLRGSSRAKSACLVIPIIPPVAEESSFFVPADGAPPAPPLEKDNDDDDDSQTLLQNVTENLSLGLLSRSRANTSDRDAREWDRYVVGYLCLLSQWLWEDPKSVREFLNAGGLGVVSLLSLL